MGYVRYYRDPECPYYQISTCVHQSHASRKHTHLELAIALVTGGSSLFRFGEKEYRINQGQLVMIGPGFVHQCCPEEVENWSFMMLFVDTAWLDAVGLPTPERPCFVVKDFEPSLYVQLLAHFESLCRPGSGKDETLLFLVDQALSEPNHITLSLGAEEYGSDAVLRVSTHIRQHLAIPLPLEELAEIAQIDKYLLIRYFGREFNTTPHAWQLMLRMNEAKRLLEAGSPIADTALAVGFYDQSHFSRLFKECFGITPGKHFTLNEPRKTI